MPRQDARDPYIDLMADGTELLGFGGQGQFIFDLCNSEVIKECVTNINLISIIEDMYPKIPWQPFSQFDIDDTKALIIGGMPIMGHIEDWTGFGYSYENKSKVDTLLHKEIMSQISVSKPWLRRIDVNPNNMGLISEEIMILHNVMSYTKNDAYNRMLQKLWFPIVYHTISYISNECPQAPVVFTSDTAALVYKNAVRTSKHVMICENSNRSDGLEWPDAYLAMESLINIEFPTANFDLERSLKYGSRREAAL